MALYKELHRPRKSLNFDSPNAEMNFLKSMTSKLSKDSPKLDFQFISLFFTNKILFSQ